MTFATAKYIEMKQAFGQGYVDNVTPWMLKDGETPYMRNARVTGYDVSIRTGHQLFSTLGSSGRPYGMAVYNRNVSANTKMIVRYNYSGTQKLVQVDLGTGVVTPITTAALITVDGRTTFQNGLDVIYVMNGTDLFGKLSGTTYSTITANVPVGFAPKFACLFNGSMWASGWGTNPSIVYKSVGKNYEDFSSAGSDTFQFTGNITGLAATNQSIFYFTADNVWATGFSDITQSGTTVSYFNRPVQTQEGCVVQGTIVTAGDDMYYLTPTAKIMKVTRGSQVYWFETQNLSHRPYNGISKLMDSLDPDQSEAFGFYISEKNLLKYFFKTRGSTFNNISVVYDIEKDLFMIDSNKYYYDWVYINETPYAASHIEPKIFKCETGQDDDDMPVAFDYRTKVFNLGDPSMKKLWWEVRTGCQMNALAVLTQEIYIDGVLADTITINGANLPATDNGVGTQAFWVQPIGNEQNENLPEMQDVQIIRSKWVLRRKGKSLQIRWYCNSLGGKVTLQSFDICQEMLNPKASNYSTTVTTPYVLKDYLQTETLAPITTWSEDLIFT